VGGVLYVDGGLVCIPDSHSHRVTNIRCRIDTAVSSDDGQIVAGNM
jgi:hypothetical protein